jgi:glycine betaine/choline ABC-type transport system substrate-binding protein
MTTKSKALLIGAVVVLVVAVAVIAVWQVLTSADVVIGGKDFTEQSILAHMMSILIEENTDLTVKAKTYLGGTMVCWNGLQSRQLDAYAEYTGTALVTILKEPVIADPDDAYERVKRRCREEYDLVWLKPFGFNNTYTLTMRSEQAGELGIETFSDLAEYLRSGREPQLTAAFTAEFLQRPDGYKGLIEAYDLQFPEEPKQVDPGLMYRNCADGAVDVICGFATDGRISAFGLKTLEDDKGFFPPYYAAPVVRADTLKEYPQLEAILNKLAGRISDTTMQRLNYEVDGKRRKPEDVARDFLQAEGLIGQAAAPPTTRPAE